MKNDFKAEKQIEIAIDTNNVREYEIIIKLPSI